ncbi:MAG: DUF2313 domain-containing protein [Undibacterium sp.]|uniref:YmfQ family protein n=1 Tax=Undibacterium sp. TaxID=1914977 RepID=UPI002726CF16|nr:putative phage tail protein [Undibacterium sp.]MDO8654181.1 DUF2313 domain-containing protein [Undibacterium sp.]
MTHSDILKRLLPPNAYDPNGSQLSIELHAEGAVMDAALTLGDSLLDEFFPDTCVATLTDWERVYGLPDSCRATAQTVAERRASLVAKVRAGGGLSKKYFLQLATDLGYVDTTITEFKPVHCEMHCESAIRETPWRFLWQVNLPHQGNNHTFMRADSTCNSRVDSYTFSQLECVFMRLKPAHTYVKFTYKAIP